MNAPDRYERSVVPEGTKKVNLLVITIFWEMDSEAAKTARESLELVFHISNLLDTGLDRHTLSVLTALCDLGLNPEALAAVVKELRKDPSSSPLASQSIL